MQAIGLWAPEATDADRTLLSWQSGSASSASGLLRKEAKRERHKVPDMDHMVATLGRVAAINQSRNACMR